MQHMTDHDSVGDHPFQKKSKAVWVLEVEHLTAKKVPQKIAGQGAVEHRSGEGDRQRLGLGTGHPKMVHFEGLGLLVIDLEKGRVMMGFRCYDFCFFMTYVYLYVYTYIYIYNYIYICIYIVRCFKYVVGICRYITPWGSSKAGGLQGWKNPEFGCFFFG